MRDSTHCQYTTYNVLYSKHSRQDGKIAELKGKSTVHPEEDLLVPITTGKFRSKASPDAVENRKFYCPCRDSNTDSSTVKHIAQTLYRLIIPGERNEQNYRHKSENSIILLHHIASEVCFSTRVTIVKDSL